MQDAFKNITTQPILGWNNNSIHADLLRLDLLHPVVSGNKWFKLRYYLEDAMTTQKKTIVSFGGAYSNHIVAMAYACKNAGLQSVGIIRGEEPAILSHTLKAAISYGMQPIFVSREAYKNKMQLQDHLHQKGWYWIGEGGYGIKGAEGAATILQTTDTVNYTDILCAAGTGTMMAGCIKGSLPHQRVSGISVLKNHHSLRPEVEALLTAAERNRRYTFFPNDYFGGYAKHPAELIEYMNNLFRQEQIPTDIVYTGKLLFKVSDLIRNNYFPPGSRILVIHSGGLQGNESLPPGKLIY
ncbi:MAG TPA: pyridoxal-phosphate dependent enzyme [Sediminibacterium sp.]|nr:pyridoxal-phosphate dependent enzyme [Sediminibacterium sp.]